MKDASWNDCLENNSAKKVTPNPARASSLIETAEERLSIVPDINEKNCNFVFEDYYTSLLELLQAIVLKEGYNILNHLCLGYYLRDSLQRDDLYKVFDDLRYKRNGLTYYGNRMDFDTSKQAIENCKRLIKEFKSILG